MAKVYDPTDCKISFIGFPLNAGIADGTFLKVMRNAPAATLKVASDGAAVINRGHDKSGKAELTVQRASAVNAYLSAAAVAWQEKTGGIGAFFVKDLAGNSLCVSPDAVIEKPADFERAKEHGDVTWTFLLTNVDIIEAGIEG
jgi:hypothetical protein